MTRVFLGRSVLCISQSDETCVDVGPLVVGTVGHHHLTVANNSACNLQYQLLVEQFVSGPYGDDELPQDDETFGIVCVYTPLLFLFFTNCWAVGASTLWQTCPHFCFLSILP